MARYEPQTEVAKALGALADELLKAVMLPAMARVMMPQILSAIDANLERIDADPDNALRQLRPQVARVAAAVDLTCRELGDAAVAAAGRAS